MRKHTNVQFNRPVVLPGALAGAAIGVGVPAITLIWGKQLPPSMQMILIIVAVSVGGLISLVAAFFGAVMPSSVGEDKTPEEDAEGDRQTADPPKP